jgi:uncharacterized membrane protein YjgN (DUF898 family)
VGVLAAGLALTFAWPLAHPFLAAAAILAAPWFLRSAFAFQARNTVWRGLHFDCVTSQRDAFKAVAPLLLWPATQLAVELAMRYWTSAQLEVLLSLLPYLVLIIVWPRVVAAVLHLRLAGTRYGSTRFELTIPLNEFRKVFYRGLGLFWLKIGVAAAVLLVALALLGNADTLALAQPLVMFTVASTGTGFVRARRFNLGVHRLVGEGGVRLRSSLTPERLSYTYLFNALWIVATCGLAAPWRRVVTLRQRARHFAVFFEADAARFRRAAMASAGALGEAAAEGLDLDLSL